MKICILTPRFPFPENGGDVLRINNIARYLKSQGHTLVLVSYHERHCDKAQAATLYDRVYTTKRRSLVSMYYALNYWFWGKPIQCGYYYSRAFGRLFRQVMATEKPKLYIAHLLRMAPYLEENDLQDYSIVEMTDALSKTYGLSAATKGFGLKKFIYRMERLPIRRYEQLAICTFPKVVLVSQQDIDFLKLISNDFSGSLALHTNGVECPPATSTHYNPNKICFIGNMRTLQNQDAVLHFANDIFPTIQRQVPQAQLYIIGAEPPQRITDLGKRPGVVVTGFVDNLEAAIADACMAVAPVRIAAGIQNKVLVAMANRLPVVMTSLIAQAIPELRHGHNCMICDQNDDFANACIQIINDKELRQQLSTNGHQTVAQHYSWQEKLKGYEKLPHEYTSYPYITKPLTDE